MVSTPTARIPCREKSSYTVWSMRSRALAGRVRSLPEERGLTVTSMRYRAVYTVAKKESVKSSTIDTDLYRSQVKLRRYKRKRAWRFSRPFFAVCFRQRCGWRSILEEREVAGGAEVHHVRNDERHIGVAHAQPARECRGVLVDGDARHRVSLPDVDVGAEGGRSERSVYFVAEDRAAEHEVMGAPAVI